MCKVYNHSKAVHLVHNTPAKGAETTPAFPTCGRITDQIVSIVGQCQIRHPHAVEFPEQ